MTNLITLKINKDFATYKKDTLIELDADVDGTPIDSYWQRRLQDSKIDNCVSIVQDGNMKDNGKNSPKNIK